MRENNGSSDNILGTTKTTFAIVEQLRENNGMGVTELADALERSKSTVHNHLQTLHQMGYVVKQEKKYYLGLKFLDLGNAARNRWNLYQVAKQEVDELVSNVGERGQVMVEEGGKGIYIYQSRAERAVQTDSHIGTTVNLHATAVGKAYLAHIPEDYRNKLLNELEFSKLTDTTYTNQVAFEEELETIRDQGFAFNDEERIAGMRAVGAPILGPKDYAIAAISISGPTTRMNGERYKSEMPELVQETAKIIGIRATYS